MRSLNVRPLALSLAVCALPLLLVSSASAFSQVEQLHSKNGVLRATFTAAPTDARIDGKVRKGAYTYNGRYVGPTLNVHPGDRIELTIKSQLPDETNIHFHGMHVSPAGISDNVLRRFMPGREYRVSVKIPHDHPNGLYWYHPHLHGQVNGQVFRGMAGMIVVSGGEARVRSLEHFKQRQLGLTATQYTSDGSALINPNDQTDATITTLVNRNSKQKLTMQPGRVERWRIANMSNEVFMKLALEGHQLWVVGIDGNPTRVAIRQKTILIPPGSRYEVLVKAAKRGVYKFKQLPYNEGFNTFPAQDLLTLTVRGKTVRSDRIPRHLRPFEDLSHARVATRRTWRLAFGPDSAPTFEALINGKQFSPDRVDTVAKLGSVEEWTFINETTEQHPLHIHTNDFQVVAVNGKRRKPQAPLDNYIVPASGSLTIRFKPVTYTGIAVFHCHILFHEDSGMMATIKFEKSPKASSVVRPFGAPSVHDQAVAEARAFDPGSTDPDGPWHTAHSTAHLTGLHSAHLRWFPGAPSPGDPLYWLYCKLDEPA